MNLRDFLKSNATTFIVTSLFIISTLFYENYINQTLFVSSALIILFSLLLFIILIFKDKVKSHFNLGFITINLVISFLLMILILLAILISDNMLNLHLISKEGTSSYIWAIYLIFSLLTKNLSKISGKYLFYAIIITPILYLPITFISGIILSLSGIKVTDAYPTLIFVTFLTIIIGTISNKIKN